MIPFLFLLPVISGKSLFVSHFVYQMTVISYLNSLPAVLHD